MATPSRSEAAVTVIIIQHENDYLSPVSLSRFPTGYSCQDSIAINFFPTFLIFFRFFLPSLPDEPTRAGLRLGACDQLHPLHQHPALPWLCRPILQLARRSRSKFFANQWRDSRRSAQRQVCSGWYWSSRGLSRASLKLCPPCTGLVAASFCESFCRR